MAYGSADTGFGANASVFHLDASDADTVLIPDADLLFNGAFKRHGPDLILTGHDGDRHVVPGYFSSEHHPALVAPNGARLSADLVDLLAGSPAPNEYAQAASTAPASPIGKVEKIVGHVVVFRNGAEVALNVGDAVYKGDVIQTGVNSACGVDFPDGTALNLVANTRMALNEFSFDPNSHSNDALFSLVQGTFAFVAGKVAHTGDMKIETPVATMGIRGTTGFVQEQVATISANAGNVTYAFAVVEDYATHRLGSYEVVDNNPNSPTYGQVIATVSQNGFLTFVTPQGTDLPPIVTTQPMTNSQLGFEQQIIDDLFAILNSGTTPQSTPGAPGSSTPPDDMPRLLQLLQNDIGNTYTFNVANGGYGQTPVTATINGGGTAPNNPGPGQQNSSNIFIWGTTNGPGTWITPTWSQPGFPNASEDTVEVLSGPLTYNGNYTIGSLYVAPGVIFDIVGGSLTVLGAVDDEGTILVTGDPPALKIEGPLTVGSAGHLRASGAGDVIDIDNTADNLGVIAATDHGKIVFDHSDLTNEGTLKADDLGTIKIKHSTLDNTGKIEAKDGGTISFDHSAVNDDNAKIVASTGGSIDFDKNSRVVNAHKSLIEAKNGGTVWFDGDTVVNKQHSAIEAVDCGLVVFCGVADLVNKSGGKILAEDHGTIKFDDTFVTNDGGTIAAIGCDAKVELADSFIGGGTLKTDNGGVIETVYGCSTLDGVTIGCNSYLLVNNCTTLTLSGGTTMDGGTLCIACHGAVDIDTCQGATLDGVAVWNRGTIDVGEWGRATLTLANGTSIHGGDLCIGCHGTVDITTCQGATLDGVTVWNRGTIDVGEWGRATLTLADGTTIHDGTLFIACHGAVDIDTCQGATLDGVAVWNRGTIDVGEWGRATLTLADGTSIHGGDLCIGCHGTVDITTCQGAPLDGVTVWNRGTIDVGEWGRATLTLADGTAIHDGTLCIGCHGTVDITTCQGATLDGVAVWNSGTIDVGEWGRATLTLADGTDIHGGDLCIGCYGTVDITTCQGAILDGVAVWNSGDIQVGNWRQTTLTLGGDTSISGDGTVSVGGGSTVSADENTAVSIAASIIDNCGTIEASNSAVLTLTTSDSLSNYGTIEASGNGSRLNLSTTAGDNVVQNGGTIEATNHATIDFEHSGGQPTLTVDNNGGTIEAIGNGATVALHHVTVDNTDGGNNDGVIKAAGTSTVELFNGTDIIGGTISANGSGVVEITNTAGHTGANVTFDGSAQSLTINGAGDVQVDDATSLTLVGTIDNHGTIDLGVTSGAILTIDGTVNLDDQGVVNLVAGDTIAGGSSGGTLNNHNTIAGAGAIGDGTTDLALDNTNNGIINATGTLTIDTGDNAIINAGTLEATGPTGDLIVASAVTGTGSVTIGNGAVVEFESTVSSHQTVTFSDGGYGELIIDDAGGFSGKIAGFTGTAAPGAPSLATTDEIDVTNVDFLSDSFSEHYNSMTGVLKISDGATTAKLTFTDFSGTFQFATDGSGGTLIYDPPATNAANPSASQSNDSFVFHTGPNGGNTGASWDAGAQDHAGWAHAQHEWSQLAGDMSGAVAADIAQHVESHWHYALHSAEHLH